MRSGLRVIQHIVRGILRGEDMKSISGVSLLGARGSDNMFFGMSAVIGHFNKTIRVFINLVSRRFELCGQRTIPKQMAMFMAFTAAERDMFII